MSATTAYVKLKNPNKWRVVMASASDLTWVWGRRTRAVVLFQSSSGGASVDQAMTHTLRTIIHEVEYATGGTTPVTEDSTITPYRAGVAASNVITAVLPSFNSANMTLLDLQVTDFLRFTGTGLPTGGLYFRSDNVSAVFNVAPQSAGTPAIASNTIYGQMRSPAKVLGLTGSSLAWTSGARMTANVVFQSAARSTDQLQHKVRSVIHEVEYTPGTTTAVEEDTAIAAFNQVASTNVTYGVGIYYLGNYDTANITVEDVKLWPFIRVTGTGLPTAGLYLDEDELDGLFNVSPGTGDLI